MKVTQEKLPDSQIGLEIEISAEASKKAYESVVRELARTTNLPGFRKGKVPRQILIQRLGTTRVKAAALENIIQSSLEEAIEQESLEILGNHQLRSSFEELLARYKPGETLTFSASVDVPPSAELGEEYKNLSVKAEESTYKPEQVEDFIEQRRKERATLVPVEDRSAQMEDVVVVDYEGKYAVAVEGKEAGEAIPGTEAKDFQVELEEGRLIPGMVEGIVGMNVQETKDLNLTFPEDYPKEELAGIEVVFTISLKEIKEKELPELDDDFAQEVSEFETMAELRSSLESQFQEKAEKDTKNSIHGAIAKQLLEKLGDSLEIPETMIKEKINAMLTQTAIQMQQVGVDFKQLFTQDTISKMRERSRPEAIEQLKQKLILSEISKKEGLEAEEAEITAKIAEIKEQLAEQELDLDRLREIVIEDLRQEKTLNWLQEQVNVELVPEGSLQEEETQTESEEIPSDFEPSEG